MSDNTPMSNDPDELRRQIEQTRGNLSQDVNALGEAVQPGNVAKRQAEKVQDKVVGAGRNLRERIMGSDGDDVRERYYGQPVYGSPESGRYAPADVHSTQPGATERMGEAADAARARVGDAADSARHAAGDFADTARAKAEQAPAMVRRQTAGSPLAAGLIALGAGWLLGALAPATETERRAAVRAKEGVQEHAGPIVEEAKAVAQDAADNLRPAAEQAAASLKDSAAASVENVKAEGQTAAQDVKASAAESKDAVKDQVQS